MADQEFTVPEFNLLLSLVHLRGSGTTTDFRSAFGFEKVETRAQKGLSERGLVTIDRGVRPYVYELTDAGWLGARKLLSEPAPAGVSQRTARILWAVIGDFAAHMDRTGTELADLYPPRTEAPVSEQIKEAYLNEVDEPEAWLTLRRLRELLTGPDREAVDRTLAELHAAREIRLIPEANQKILTDADRSAALWLGGEYRHLIAIEAR